MKNHFIRSVLVVLALVSLPLHANEALGLSANVVWKELQGSADNVLFIDVRDPVEIMFVGFTDKVDQNIPFRLTDRTVWNEKKSVFQMKPNKDFIAQVDSALEAKGLDRNAKIITMCRSGSARGKPSAEFLRKQGFPNVFYVVHGFQGDKAKSGDKQGMRIVNGWQNDGLPWSPKANGKKIYRSDQ